MHFLKYIADILVKLSENQTSDEKDKSKIKIFFLRNSLLERLDECFQDYNKVHINFKKMARFIFESTLEPN